MLKTHSLQLCRRLLLAAFLFLPACSPSAKPIIPPVAVPEAFSSPGLLEQSALWWQDFEDPLLDSLVEKALRSNLSLAAVWDRLQQAEAVAKREGASLFPNVNLQAGASRKGQQISSAGTETRSWASEHSIGLLADYELDLWGRVRAAKNAAAYNLQATREELHAAAISLSAEVARTWYRLVEANAQLEMLEEQKATNQQVLSLVTLRFRRGQVGAADVLRQQQLLESIVAEQISVASQRQVLKHQLAVLLAEPPRSKLPQESSSFVSLPPLPITGLPATLLQRRPDLKSSFYKVYAADRALAGAIADRFPKVSISASATAADEKLRDVFDNWIANLAANMLAPVFDAGRRSAEVERNKALVSQRLREYGQSILMALSEVENALVQEEQQKTFIQSLEAQIKLSERVLHRVQERYTKGAGEYLSVLTALQSNQALLRSRLSAKRQLLEYRIALCRAIAGSWEMKPPELLKIEN